MMYDVIIVGAGPGGIFSAYELVQKKPGLKIAVFEAGNPLSKRHCPIDGEKVKTCIGCKTCAIMSGFGGAGAFSDGKYNITNDFGGTLYEHIGKKTVSSMNAGGVLRDKAHKLFRGTIDFPLGSSGAKGDENEDVLILGEDVINQTVPLILCAEEDVEGNHGASIGRPSDDVLFYLASRGLDEEEACNLMARAKLDALCSKIGGEELETLAKSCLEEVTGYANEKL